MGRGETEKLVGYRKWTPIKQPQRGSVQLEEDCDLAPAWCLLFALPRQYNLV